MTREEEINKIIKDEKLDTNKISDGYHTYEELYDHRIVNYIALCRFVDRYSGEIVWRSKVHSDGSVWNGWFLLGIGKEHGSQITYHLPISEWSNTEFATEYDEAPDFDGHTPDDVLERIRNL
jgi:hypothetical protein